MWYLIKRHRERRLPEHILQEALDISPTLSESVTSQSPTLLPERSRRPHLSEQPNESRRSSSQARTPTNTRPRPQQHSTVEIAPRVPSRRSSKQAHTNSSNEYLSQRDPHNPRQHRSESDLGLRQKSGHPCPLPRLQPDPHFYPRVV
jgi:hypothetical protein